MPSFPQPDAFVSHLRQVLSERYRPFAGALFSAVVARDEGSEWFLASGRALFLDEPVEERPATRYSRIHLLEEWVEGQEPAVLRLTELFTTGGAIAGVRIPTNGFAYTHENMPWAWGLRLTPWRETHYRSDPPARNGSRPSLTREPVVGFGLSPYRTGAHAVQEWLNRELRGSRQSQDPANIGSFSTIIPDTRARIVSAEWRLGGLRVAMQTNVPREQLELQCLHEDGGEPRERLLRGPKESEEVTVPEGTQALSLFLLHSSGELLGEARLSQLDRIYDGHADAVQREEQAITDIQGGETGEVEFKPFLRQGSEKAVEVVETVVAFANSRGGRVYFGVDDHRQVEGRSFLARAMNQKEETARPAFEQMIAKLVTDKVKPVPKVRYRFIEYQGEPVFILEVERGAERPYATSTNEFFIRKGASNVRPDPTTELPLITTPYLFPRNRPADAARLETRLVEAC